MTRLHRDKFPAVLQHEAKSRDDDATAHPAVIASDETEHVAFVISRAQINRVALVERRISSFDLFLGTIWIDQLTPLRRVTFRKQTGERNLGQGGIGGKFGAIRPGDLL